MEGGGGASFVAPEAWMRRPLWQRLVGLVSVAFFGEIAYGFITTFALPLYLGNTLGWRISGIGPVISAFLLAETLGKLAFAGLSDRIGRKPLIIAGLVISAIAVFCMTFANTPGAAQFFTPASVLVNHIANGLQAVLHVFHIPWLIRQTDPQHIGFWLLAALNGIGGAAVWPNVWASVADVTTDHERVGSMSVFNMMNMIGLGSAPLLGSLISSFALKHPNSKLLRPQMPHMPHHHGPKAVKAAEMAQKIAPHAAPLAAVGTDAANKIPSLVFLATAALFLVALLFALVLIPWLRGTAAKKAEEDARTPERFVMSYPVLVFFLALSFCQTLGLQIMSGSLVIYINRVLKLTPSKIGLPFIVLAVLVLCVAIPVGALGGWWGRVKSVKLGLALAAIGMVMLPFRPNIWWFLSVAIPMIVGILFSVPAWLAIITELAPESWRGRVFGYVSSAQSAGAILGPSIGTALFDKIGPAAPFHASGLVLGLTLFASLFGLREGMRAVRPLEGD